jgi:hypothetical protein
MAKHGPKLVKDRYPLHRGPFLFAPHFLTVSEWFPDFHRLIEKVLLDVNVTATILKPYEGRQARIEFSEAEMTIDGDGGIFFVDKLGTSNLPFEEMTSDDWSGPCAAPRQFFEELRDPRYIALLGNDYKVVCKFADLLYRRMEHRFGKALKNGLGQVTARIGSQFAEPTDIDAWQLGYLNVIQKERERYFSDDRDFDEAVARDGTRLFGLGVAPIIVGDTVSANAHHEKASGTRGRKPTVNYDELHRVMLALIRTKGIPGPKKPNWTGALFVKAVRAQIGSTAPGRTTIFENLRPVIAAFKKHQSSMGFRQSDNSKPRVN